MSAHRYSYADIARRSRRQRAVRGAPANEGIMRNQPRPDFVARVIEALPADGTLISSRDVFFALDEISTPAYVRIVLRQLAIAGHIIARGPSGQRLYQRLPGATGDRSRSRGAGRGTESHNDAQGRQETC
jgi:hypothetical protein